MLQIVRFLIIPSYFIASRFFVRLCAINSPQGIIHPSTHLFSLSFFPLIFLELSQLVFSGRSDSFYPENEGRRKIVFGRSANYEYEKAVSLHFIEYWICRESTRRIRSVFCILQSVFRERKNELIHGNHWIAVENIGEGRSEVCNSWKANKQWIASFDVTKCYDSINLVLIFLTDYCE